ncbi:AFH_G0010020.mRNA.1.CDS.1 [Saccharomyces cerevisiae]|nr:AFH_G0010020.mRNA.1.CDS.1 [Saccharomyces cerevisiae]CAI6559072.1 AFH_G0010020.mRNA.1.CDS.1 [Saccharomyces cerevisiae]
MCSSINEGPYNSPTFGKSLSLKVDGGFNAVSINPSGRDIVLASRQGLYIIDLDDPFTPPRWLHHITPWQVADVQWSPHPAKPYWIVSTSNQKAIIWNLAKSSSNAIEFVLHGHSRAITDINFNPQHPDVLATCSVDTYVHAWDMRSPHRPFYSTSSWRSAASQVKWNYKDPNVLASSHGNDIFVWDLRKGSTPLCSLKGHVSSVNSIDFNRFKYSEIMSSSNDGTVKFWDYSKSTTESKRTVTTNFPIWRGRYLPFGEGYCIMPMVGGNNAVYLVNLCDDDDSEQNKKTKLQPIYAFKGHSDRVIDFLWRSRHTYDGDYDDREFQLVTWSKDCDLKLWPISDSIYGKVNFDRGKRLEEKLPDYDYCSYNKEPENRENVQKNEFRRLRENFVTTSGLKKNKTNHITWLSGIRMNSATSQEDLFNETKIQNLGEEVSAIGHKFPKVVFEKISVSTRELCLTLNGPWSEENPDDYIFLRISINFPPNYPNKGDPPQIHN